MARRLKEVTELIGEAISEGSCGVDIRVLEYDYDILYIEMDGRVFSLEVSRVPKEEAEVLLKENR